MVKIRSACPAIQRIFRALVAKQFTLMLVAELNGPIILHVVSSNQLGPLWTASSGYSLLLNRHKVEARTSSPPYSNVVTANKIVGKVSIGIPG